MPAAHKPLWLVVAVIDALCGLANLLLALGHLQGVFRKAFGGPEPFNYNFHFYSVVMVGVLVAAPGLVCLWQVRGLAHGERQSWKSALGANLAVIAVNAPLLPFNDFPGVLIGCAAVNLIALGITRGDFRAKPQ
ncbi:MAG: hypothetical protein ACRD2K_00245 [Terriglobales bacterium]